MSSKTDSTACYELWYNARTSYPLDNRIFHGPLRSKYRYFSSPPSPPTVYVLKEHPLRGRVRRRRWQVKMEVALHIRELGKKLLYSGSDFSGPLIERRFRHPPDCKAKKMGNRPITPYVVDDRFNSNCHYFFSKSLLSITVAGHKSWRICSKWTLWTIILTLFTIGRTK